MPEYRPLRNWDRDELVSLLSLRPEENIIMLSNIRLFGIEQGNTVFNGDYFGKWRGKKLVGVGALYNLGSLFFHAVDNAALDGMENYVSGLGRFPRFLSGPAGRVERLAGSLFLDDRLNVKVEESDLMVLRGPVPGDVGGRGARRAKQEDLEEMLEMAQMFESELFGGEIEDKSSLRELVAYQVKKGAASVARVDGVLASKAEATVLERVGAQVGGVYTRQEYRGKGYSTRCVANLSRRLLAIVPLVSLVVHKGNYPAIAVYRKIGFARVEDWKIAAVT